MRPDGDPSLPLIVHVIHRLGVGGLENGLVNLINHSPRDRYRHAIVCLTEATDFRRRIERSDVPILEMHKRSGHEWGLYRRLWHCLRELRPAILHTRNFGTLDGVPPARFAGIHRHVHGLHGWDVNDLHGTNRRYALARRVLDPFTQRYIAVSRDLARWLVNRIGVAAEKVVQIYNGVDTQRFRPAGENARAVLPADFASPDRFVIGWVGRMDAVKDPMSLLRAFHGLIVSQPTLRGWLRLAMVGSGALEADVRGFVAGNGIESLVWLPGAREDVPAVLRSFDLFVLPSLNEGISNTILEAMASGLPVIATRVGGNPELVTERTDGSLVAAGDTAALGQELLRCAADRELTRRLGAAARDKVEARFSMSSMVRGYLDVYDTLLAR
jgi:sugar transferase (PEP-CTERM/EpsH1 system associated)